MAVAISSHLPLSFTSKSISYRSMELTSEGQHFGRYQGTQNTENDGGERTPSSVSLEALVAFLGQSSEGDVYENSQPAHSHRVTSLTNCTYRKIQSFPKVTKDLVASHTAVDKRPVRSRSVRFADSQGLPLERIRSLTAADPFQTEGEIVPSLSNDLGALVKAEEVPITAAKVHLRKLKFSQPGTQPNFYQRLQTQKVCLESVRCEARAIHGIVRTLNLCYEKHVHVRWTNDQWQTFCSTVCTYCAGSSDGYTDRFSFTLPVTGSENNLEFAICYCGQGAEYWDNNETRNYVITL